MSGRNAPDRLERLVNLLVALLDTRRPLSRDELRGRVGGYSEDPASFRRNFERDKELLRQMGIPVLAEPLQPGAAQDQTGYWVPRELYEMRDPGLNEEELMALSLAGSLVELRGEGAGDGASSALRKLGRAPAALQAGPVADVPLSAEVATLFSAVADRQSVSFAYNGVVRQVDPYRLSYRDGHWYVAGFDHSRGAERLFRVDRLEAKVRLEGKPGAFARPEGPPAGPPPPWRLGEDAPVVVELLVDASQAPWVRRLAGEEAIAGEEPSGATRFRLEVTNWEGFRGFVLGLLDHAEVVSPPEAREALVSWLLAIAGAQTAADRPAVAAGGAAEAGERAKRGGAPW